MKTEQLIAIGFSPVSFPATVLTGGLKGEAGLAGGMLLLLSAIANIAYWGIAYGISKKMPGKEVMKKALIVWAVMFVACVIYLNTLKKEVDAKPKPPVFATNP